MSGNLIVAAVVFVVSVAVAIGLSLFVITVVLRIQAKHRRRLARVGRKRMSGRLDIDDMRMTLLRQKQEKNVLVTVTDARVVGPSTTFGERPDVEMPTATSPGRPNASTWRPNTRSKP